MKKTKSKSKIKKEIQPFKNNLTKLLDQTKVKYKVLEHKVVYTAHDVSATTKKKLSEIAKVVLIKVEGKEGAPLLRGAPSFHALVVVPAGKYLDFSGIKKALKAKKVSMASEKDIIKHLKTKVGLLHPFGSLYNIPTILDKTLSKSKKLLASAGSYTHSLEISVKDFEKLVKPIKGMFSKSKR